MNHFFRHHVIPWVGATIIRTWAGSMKMELVDVTDLFGLRKREPVIFALWHNQLFLAPYFYRQHEGKRKLVAMASRSKDGQWLVDMLQRFQIDAARGSTSKAGSSAARQVARLVQREQYDVVITPDGPRGPRYQLHPGLLYLSQLTGSPIVPLRIEYEKKWCLRSWDRFQLPCPLTRGRVIFGTPRAVPILATPSQLALIQEQLKQDLGGDSGKNSE